VAAPLLRPTPPARRTSAKLHAGLDAREVLQLTQPPLHGPQGEVELVATAWSLSSASSMLRMRRSRIGASITRPSVGTAPSSKLDSSSG